MLEIKDIHKIYTSKDMQVEALKGVTMRFRKSEFVSILGPSGCGKTTLLNVIGGLDRYDAGDLIIDGVSTKNYKDKDWDNYRNHRVGFVFQSYNLIPHQTVLENVELALTLSGIKKAERRARAVEVLKQVGLGDKLKSKPSQLSGGQMQRVAIARALVNNPEIILADEPTGALDSKTSVQIMELLKEVSKDRLVVMVTHNPELAEQYSNRIIRLLDGELTEDSKPYTEAQCKKDLEKLQAEKQKAEQEALNQGKKNKRKKEKTSMSFFTAMFLSLKNLLSKKGRTILVSIAGSIGIFGIALILAVSAGMTGYINDMQSQSLSSFPVTVMYMNLDTSKVMDILSKDEEKEGEKTDNDKIVIETPVSYESLANYNYLSKDFIEYSKDYYAKDKGKYLNGYKITYANDFKLINTATKMPINSKITATATSGSMSSTFYQGLDAEYDNFVLSMYDILGTEQGAHMPRNANEIALVVNSNTTKLQTLYSYGMITDPTAKEIKMQDIINKTSFKLLFNDNYYTVDAGTGEVKEIVDFNSETLTSQTYLTNAQYMAQCATWFNPTDPAGIDLKVTCVLKLKDTAAGSIFPDGFMYTKQLSDLYRENCMNSNVTKEVLKTYFVNDGINFETKTGGTIAIADYTSADYNKLKFNQSAKSVKFYDKDTASGKFKIYRPEITEVEMLSSMPSVAAQFESMFVYDSPEAMYNTLVGENSSFKLDLTYEDIMQIYLQVYDASEIPLGISLYAKSFDGKDDIGVMVASYNETTKNKIVYSDTSQMLTNLLKNLVNIVSYVLIAFASISLIVSSIMIAIITYTSVIERTKEIGVLRSVGASKKDVFWVFTAETVIIGLVAGAIGVGFAGLFALFISLALKSATGVAGLAVLQPASSIALILISVTLTFIAGLVPSRIATKKDPVIALRSE